MKGPIFREVRNILCHIPGAPMPPKRNIWKSSHKQCPVMPSMKRKCRKSLHKARTKDESMDSSPVIVHARDDVGKVFSEKVSTNGWRNLPSIMGCLLIIPPGHDLPSAIFQTAKPPLINSLYSETVKPFSSKQRASHFKNVTRMPSH